LLGTGDTFLFFALALGCEVLGTIGGFGSSLFFVPVAGFFFDFHTVLGITALLHVSSNLSKIGLFRQGFSKDIILMMGLPAVLAVILGAFATRYVQADALEWVLAVFLILLSGGLMYFNNFKLRQNPTVLAGGGLLSGFLAGLLGTGGAVRGVVLTSFGLGSDAFIATSACIDMGVDSSRLLIYFLNGFVSTEQLKLIPLLFFCGFAGSLLGRQLLKKIPETNFRTLVLLLVMATGISALFTKIL
jgi:uncharacterized membrane protein YfcA